MTVEPTPGQGEQSPWPIPPRVDHQRDRDERRAVIHDWLLRKAPSLADLYVGAFYLVYLLPLPGRGRLIAHAVREICNSLPEYVAGVKAAHIPYARAVTTILREWTNAGLPVEGDGVPGALELQPSVLKPIAELLNDHVTRDNARTTAGLLFSAADPTGSTDPATLAPLAKRWREDADWWLALTHDPRKAHVPPDEGEIRKRFELLEDHLYGLSGPYFQVLEELDAILAEANA